jgi:predicted lipid-binding transport protein (Tim44 family)
MVWTGEDTKDVFKKILGGLIAAAILAMVYALVERVEWYYAGALAVLLVVLVFALFLRLARPAHPGERPAATQDGTLVLPEPRSSSESARTTSGRMPEQSSEPSHQASPLGDEKILKKAVKAEQKRRKKEAKARDKES